LIELRAVFLDLDDTLCDSRPAWAAGVNAAFDLLASHRPDIDGAQAQQQWLAVNERLLSRLEAGE
jgi:phosphoglycolate phosphatase-like HAD superfamily hydrolase